MATNFIQPGECLDLAAPYNRVSGEGALVGTIFGVATRDVASGDTIPFCVCGVWRLAKTAAQAWTVGQRIFWDDSNKRCDSDPTAGQLIGYATAAAANPSSTGDVSLCCCPPELSEGKQAAVADLVDNSGGAAADGTIGAVTAPTAIGATLTDNTGGSGAHDDTIADGLTATAPAGVTAVAVGDLDATNNGWGASSEANFDKIHTAIDALVADVTELQSKLDAAVTDLGVQNQNDSDLTQKVMELVTAQGENRTAIVALTDAIKELSTKQNALLASLRLTGLIAS
jgi:predicted RecA/RadA family phage recombinase